MDPEELVQAPAAVARRDPALGGVHADLPAPAAEFRARPVEVVESGQDAYPRPSAPSIVWKSRAVL